MKKNMALILAVALIMTLLAGCTGTTVVIGECNCPPESHTNTPVVDTPAQDAPASEGAVKTGLAVITNIGDSTAATAEEEGAAKYDITVAAVTVDDAGVITACSIDSIPATVNFDTNGAITSDLAAEIRTKDEQGADYGMVAWGGAIAEWDEQVAAVADYAVGKTIDELKNGDIDMTTGYAKDGTDLKSSATINLFSYIFAVEAAVANAQHLGAQAGDELVLTTINSISSSISATAEEAGCAQLDANIAVVTRKDGVITSCIIDAVQAKVNFDTTGTITTDLTAPVQTKNELGENYGMVAWGGAIAEWNDQAASFAAYVTGKTAAEVASIAVDETAHPTDADLVTSVTISIGEFQALIAKAAQ